MKRTYEIIKSWLKEQCDWPDETELDATVKIFCNLEPEINDIKNYYDKTKQLIVPQGDYPTPEQLRRSYPDITDVGIISMYDSFLKFDLNKGYQINNTEIEAYTDKDIVDGMIANNQKIIKYFFFTKCTPLLSYICHNVFDYQINRSELINELYLYIAKDDWYKIKQFDYRSKLTTWLSVVAIRFFQRKRAKLIENDSTEALISKKENVSKLDGIIDNRIDTRNAVKKITNQRYRLVIDRLYFNDDKPETVANDLGITVDNLYNIHRRALAQLRLIMNKKEDYYG